MQLARRTDIMAYEGDSISSLTDRLLEEEGMYKLLLVSDRKDVLEAFDLVQNWEYNGFRRPHIRQDIDGARECLKKHHADAISIAVSASEEEKLLEMLRAEYPLLPIFEAGTTPEKVSFYLNELLAELNRMRADFSSMAGNPQAMMIKSRRLLFRKLVGGTPITQEELRRWMRLVRSRMNPDGPCALLRLEQVDQADRGLFGGTPHEQDYMMERTLFQSFGGDVKGYHVLPLITDQRDTFVLVGPLRGSEEAKGTSSLSAMLNPCIEEGLSHVEEYTGLRFKVTEIEVLPCMYALCSDWIG